MSRPLLFSDIITSLKWLLDTFFTPQFHTQCQLSEMNKKSSSNSMWASALKLPKISSMAIEFFELYESLCFFWNCRNEWNIIQLFRLNLWMFPSNFL